MKIFSFFCAHHPPPTTTTTRNYIGKKVLFIYCCIYTSLYLTITVSEQKNVLFLWRVLFDGKWDLCWKMDITQRASGHTDLLGSICTAASKEVTINTVIISLYTPHVTVWIPSFRNANAHFHNTNNK